VGVAVEGVTELINLAREKRVADLVFAAATYAVGNKVQLAGNHQWNVKHADADPIADIVAGLDACIMRPNLMVIGGAGWSALSTNPYILKAVNRSSGDSGIASRRAVADLFELDDVLVGMAWNNTAKKGQTASLGKLWGKHCSLVYVEKSVQANKRITFGWTAQWRGRFAGSQPDGDIGLTGGVRVRVGEYVKEVITSSRLGYYIEDCAA
jgi:hypothetical protein